MRASKAVLSCHLPAQPLIAAAPSSAGVGGSLLALASCGASFHTYRCIALTPKPSLDHHVLVAVFVTSAQTTPLSGFGRFSKQAHTPPFPCTLEASSKTESAGKATF